MFLFLSLLLVAYGDVTNLNDGETRQENSELIWGSDKMYKFSVGEVGTSDLTISLTTYSDYSDPDMYVLRGSEPSRTNYQYSSLVWGSGSIIIPPVDLRSNSDYYILVVCYTFCRYSLTVSYAEEILLNDGIPLTGALQSGKQSIYKFITPDHPGSTLSFRVTHLTGVAHIYAIQGDQEPTSDNSVSPKRTWDGGVEFNWKQPLNNTVFRLSIMAADQISYTVLVSNSNNEPILLIASVPISGEVDTNRFNHYYINIDSSVGDLYIGLTVFSGDADIYVKANSTATRHKFDYNSTSIGNENLVISASQRASLGYPTGKYYIGIYGYLHSAYSLVATTTNTSFIVLQPGVPQSGAVNGSQMEYYYLEYPLNITNITISLSVSAGNPDLYAKFCASNLSLCYFSQTEISYPNSIYSSIHSAGSESIDIYSDGTLCTSNAKCSYVIGVLGVLPYSTYTLLVSVGNTKDIILREGKPQSINMAEPGNKFFKYTVINDTVIEVMFILTPIYGDSDIYTAYNTSVYFDTYDKSSIHSGVEIDQVSYTRGVDGESLAGSYYIMVHALQPSSFSILAKEVIPGKNTTIQLYPGHPQKDTLYNYTNRDYRIYFFPVHFTEETKQTLTITLTAITGRFTIYVANQLSNLDWNNDIFYYNWKSNSNGLNDVVTIHPGDYWYKKDSTYLILVLADKYTADKSATYLINFNAGDGTFILSEDIPYTNVVLEHEYNYYLFPIHFDHEDVKISITVFSGDPDLYVSLDPQNPNPTTVNYDYRSSSFGNEAITLIWENGLENKCPDLPENYRFGDRIHCYLYIGVYGYHTSTYSIRLHPSKDIPLSLTLGQPEYGNLNRTEYQFYYSIVDTNSSLSVLLQPLSGDSDLFLNLLDKSSAGSSPQHWERPTNKHSNYSSQSATMNEQIELTADSLSVICPSGSCIAICSVYCFSHICNYSFVIKQSQLQKLIENQATYGNTGLDFVYYSYYCDKDYTDFLITVTSISDGNPDLYITQGSETRPTQSNYTWSSTSWGGDSVLITKTDNFFKGKSMKGTYVIGVRGSWGPVSYSIIVNNNPKPIISLNTGTPQQGALKANSTAYYSFNNYIQVDILIQITPTSGSGKIYASPYFPWQGDIYSKLPDIVYKWSSQESSNRYSLSIPTDDPNFCLYCTILIAVKSDNTNFTYVITAKNSIDYTALQNGIPFRSESKNNKVNVFTFEILRNVSFEVSLAPYSGHPDVSVTTFKNITSENYYWESYYTSNPVNLHILNTSPHFKIGTYYIIVSGYESSSYTIVAHTQDSHIKLVDGWPISYSLAADPSDFVQFRFVVASGGMAFCNIKAEEEFKPRVYTIFQAFSSSVNPATPQSYEKFFNESEYNKTYSSLSMNLHHSAPNDYLNIGVYSYKYNTASAHGSFQIYCSSSSQTTVLRIGRTNIEMLNSDVKQRRYEINTENKGKLNAYVIPCIGDFKLEISNNWNVLMQEMPDVSVTRLTDGIIVGSVNNANGRYFVSVSALKPDNTDILVYELITTFTNNGDPEPKRLYPGNNGILSWLPKDSKFVTISWSPIENQDSSVAPESGVEYRVYFTKDKSSNLLSACGLHYYQSRNFVEVIGTTKTTSIQVELPANKGFVNVVGALPKNSPFIIKEIVYDPTEISLAPPPGGYGLLVFWILAALLFGAIITSIYFYKKKKRAENILNYEMSDIRNVASVTSDKNNEKRSDPYAPLSHVN
jgi:hypothetical protein